jgi:hypothetical protein
MFAVMLRDLGRGQGRTHDDNQINFQNSYGPRRFAFAVGRENRIAAER